MMRDFADDEPDCPALPDWVVDLEARCETPVTRAEGVSLQWHILGEGRPLVLLHGGHGSWLHWVRNMGPLSDHFRVMAVDLPAFGDSDIYETEDLHSYAGLVARGVAELAPGQEISAAGFSFGSVIGSLMVGQVEAGARAFAMLGSPMLGPTHPVTERLKKWRGMPVPHHRAAAHATNVGELMLTGPDSVTDEATAIQMAHAEKARGRYRGLFRKLDVPSELAAWPGELTVIYGDSDALTCRHLDERRETVARIKPEAQFHVIPGAGHWVQYQAHEAVNALLLDRLS